MLDSCVHDFVFATLGELGSTSHSVTYDTHILLRKEQQVHLIYSFATFCPQVICALLTDAKIIQFTECYASTH